MRMVVIVLVFLACVCTETIAQTPPPRPHSRTVFSNVSLSRALEIAEAEGRLLLIDIYERDGGDAAFDPAKSVLLGDLLYDAPLRAWVRENAVLVRASAWSVWDVDIRTYADWDELGLIVVKERSEVARLNAPLESEALIEWLERAKNELSPVDRALAESNGPFDDLWDLYWAKSNVCELLQQAGRHDEALPILLDVWDASDEAGAEALELRSELSFDLWDLLQDYPEGREVIEARRDALEATLRGGESTSRDLTDWIQFNYALDDEAKIVQWVERVVDRPEAQRYLQDPVLDIASILLAQEEWALAGRTMQFPVQLASMEVMANRALFAADFGDDDDGEFAAWQLDETLKSIGQYYACCLAAGRDEEAAQIVDAAMELEVDPRIVRGMMVQAAHTAGALRPMHIDWIREAQAIGVPFDQAVVRDAERAARDAPN